MTACEQYQALKRENPEALLLFRMGDFYEAFYDDAKRLAAVCGLTLTCRDRHVPEPIPMAGFPYHNLETYIRKLIAAGYRVAVAEMANPRDPRSTRPVKRIVTDGSLIGDSLETSE